MLLDTLLFFIFCHFISSEEKIICITKDSSLDSLKCSSKIEGITSGSDLTSEISSYIDTLDADIKLSLIGTNIEFKFNLNIFNNKAVTIQFDSASNGTFDVSGINNINLHIQFSSIINLYPVVQLLGSALSDDKTSITIEKIQLKADFSEIQLNSFTTTDSIFSFSKFSVNSLSINNNADTELILKDSSVTYLDQTFTFLGEKSFSISLSSNNQLVIDNQATDSSSLPFLSINTAKSVIFKGNDFVQSNLINLLDCYSINSYIGYLPLSSVNFSSSSLSDIQLNVNKGLTIKGNFELTSSRNFVVSIINNTESRIQINLDSLSLEEEGKIQVLSSWIDLIIDTLKFKSNYPPYIPCIGYGGASTLTANHIVLNGGQETMSFDSISIKLDFNEELTDKELSKLVNSEWNIITFKSFTNANAVSSFEEISFTPENVYGFGDSESTRIINVKSTVSTDYIVTLTASSMSTLPCLICYIARGNCKKGGKTIRSLSELSTAVPSDRKSITLIIGKAYAEINLTDLQTTGAELTIEYDHSIFPIISITMGDEFPNTKIDHLILNGISIGNSKGGESFVQLNSREITFIECTNSSETTITFNENSLVNIDEFSFDQLHFYVPNSFPQTNILTPIEAPTSFEISQEKYIFTDDSKTVSYSKAQLPKVAFQIELESNNDYTLIYKTTSTTIDSIDLKFISETDAKVNPKITVTFQNLDSITSANHIGLDFGPFDSGNTVDFSIYEQSKYFNFTGKNINIIPNGDDQKTNGKICACKATPCANYCENDYSQVSYSDLQQNIQQFSGNSLRIVIVGDQEGNSPILPIGLLDNKDAIIVGAGQNAKIQIDLSSEFSNENKTIEFSNITVVHSAGSSFVVSNLKLTNDTIIDSTFNSIPLTTLYFECDVSHLQFSTVSIKKSLILNGDAINSNSNTKVSFDEHSKFTFVLPKLVCINGSKLTFNNLEFDLSNVLPDFSLPDDLDELTIIANNGDIDTIGSNIEFLQTSQLKSVHFGGTWANQNASKFIVFKNFSSAISLESENTPVSIEYISFNNIKISNEKVGIAGIVTFYNGSFGDFKISTTETNKTSTLFIKEINVSYESSGTANIDFETSNINLNIETLSLTSKFKIINFNLLIDLNHHNQVNIINVFDQTRNLALRYTVACTITESLNHPQMDDFINNNHTLITLNKENSIQLHDSITFDENAPLGFDNNNFKLSNDDNKLTFYTAKSPIEDKIDLYYGKCIESCKGTQIGDEDLTKLDHFIPSDATLVVITFYDSLNNNSLLNFDYPNLSIQYLTLRSNSELRNVAVKFGNSVSNLEVDSISLINDANDAFSIEKAKLSNGASFSDNANFTNLESLTVDEESLYASNFVEFKNSLQILLEPKQPTDLNLSYTKTGMKIIDQNSKEFNIDISKLTNVTLHVKSNESPRINLEKDVKELKQIQSFVLDSSLIHIGSGWDSLEVSTPLVLYTIVPQETAVSVVTDSFPFEAWDLMYKYPIQFSDILTPFSYSDDYEINGKNLIFNTYSPSTSTYNDIEFEEIVLNGDSSIKSVSDQLDKSLIIDEIKVKKSSAAKVINAQIKDEICLEPGSSLNDNFSLSDEFSEIELEWDLNQTPLLNPSTPQTIIPKKVEIVYKGSSTEGREELFTNFLSKGVVLMKNVNSCNEIIQKVHFESESVKEFNDGNSLTIKCTCTNNNELQIILIPKSTPTSSPKPTNEPIQNETDLTIDSTSYTLASESIQFTKDGYREEGKNYSGNNNKNDILLVNAQSTSLTASTTNEQPNNDLYLSPKTKNAQITIPNANDYGQGEIGIHANSNNPTINLPKSKVPLKLFNNENSEINLKLNSEATDSISLNKLVIDNGVIKFNVPNGASGLHFDKVEVYKTGNIQSLIGQNSAETDIDFLDMKSGSEVTINNAKFGSTINTSPNSKLIINEKSTFNENTAIQLTQTSFIEFGNSIVEGVCKEIKLAETGSKSKSSLNSESEIQLACGSRFDCFAWQSKYSGNSNYPSAKCINYTNKNEMCLVASSKTNQDNNANPQNKKKLSGGAIAGICIACVVVAAVIIGVVLYCLKRHHNNKILQYNNMDAAQFEDPVHL